MLQYLLNTTAIWLISLVLFDVFLRRESYHAYNRFYLLITLLLAAIVPLFQFQEYGHINSQTLQEPVMRVITAKQSLVEVAVPASESMNLEMWLWLLYTGGALVATALLFIDVMKLVSYNKTGRKNVEGTWVVISTGREHAPFSILNTLYVSSKKQYSNEEWQMILGHERQHTTLLHFVDLMLMQLGRIFFWFHPLIYIYNKRLLLVHEYQADTATKEQPQVYGTFLVEQALLQAAPSITHSFNRSPIKNRLVMLTKKSSAASKIKMLVFVPLALVCLICFSKNVFSREFEKKGDIVKYNGNTFQLSKAIYDTVEVEDPTEKGWVTKVAVTEPKPIKMNGAPIPEKVDQQPFFNGSDKDLRDYIVKNMKKELSNLDDGLYRLDIRDILVDEKGRIVYFSYSDLKRSKTEIPTEKIEKVQVVNKADPAVSVTINAPQGAISVELNQTTGSQFYAEISKKNQTAIYNKVCQLMKAAPRFTPGTFNGKKVVATYLCPRFWNHVKVKDHKIYDIGKDFEFYELK